MAQTVIKTAKAFCPAHVTGFFKAHIDSVYGDDDNQNVNNNDSTIHHNNIGSTGAGFSLALGVTTRVVAKDKISNDKASFPPYVITFTKSYEPDIDTYGTEQMSLSKNVIEKFLKLVKRPNVIIEANHEIAIPIGYGLGSSAAAALSLAYALDDALETHMTKEQIGSIAHAAEIECKTGLGDVLASYYGGFEIRTAPGAPGVGRVQIIKTQNVSITMICLSPISTKQFITEHLSKINGLGGEMITKLKKSKDYGDFQTMSLEFANYVGVITLRMKEIIKKLHDENIKCGVALFGETIFCMTEADSMAEKRVEQIFRQYDKGMVIKSKIDERGARLLHNKM